jgi:hypothetical protein
MFDDKKFEIQPVLSTDSEVLRTSQKGKRQKIE